MTTPQPLPIVLRTAAVWGTTVLAVQNLDRGESLKIGESEGSVVAKPDGSLVADLESVAAALRIVAERNRVIAEGAGAMPLAAALTGKAGQGPIVCIVSGGNIDVNVIARIIERGLVKEGRRVMLSLRVPDRPGMLAGVLATVAAERANVLEVHHNRTFFQGAIGDTEIELSLETKGPEHVEQLITALGGKGFQVVRR